jgi:hypothetical protein
MGLIINILAPGGNEAGVLDWGQMAKASENTDGYWKNIAPHKGRLNVHGASDTTVHGHIEVSGWRADVDLKLVFKGSHLACGHSRINRHVA